MHNLVYKVITGSPEQVEAQLNELSKQADRNPREYDHFKIEGMTSGCPDSAVGTTVIISMFTKVENK